MSCCAKVLNTVAISQLTGFDELSSVCEFETLENFPPLYFPHHYIVLLKWSLALVPGDFTYKATVEVKDEC